MFGGDGTHSSLRDVSSVQFWVMWSPLHRHIVKPLTFLRQNLWYATRFSEFLWPTRHNWMSNNTSVKIVSSRLEQLYRLVTFDTCSGLFWARCIFLSWMFHACMINLWIYIKLLTQTKQWWFCMVFCSLNVLI